MHVTFSFAFSSRYAKTRTSDFRKVVWQHIEGMIGNIIWNLLEIYFSFQQWKKIENPLRIDKVIAMSLIYYFSGHSVLLKKTNECLLYGHTCKGVSLRPLHLCSGHKLNISVAYKTYATTCQSIQNWVKVNMPHAGIVNTSYGSGRPVTAGD